jgi:hypothetical protein
MLVIEDIELEPVVIFFMLVLFGFISWGIFLFA